MAVRILQEIAQGTVQDARFSCYQCCGMFSVFKARATGFYADQLYVGIGCERVEQANGIATTANTGYGEIW